MDLRAEPHQPLKGIRVLVADDEFLIALTIEEVLRDAGAEVVSASTLAVALKAAQDAGLSAAVLDFRLGRQTTEAVADALAAQSIPFVFYTGQTLPDAVSQRFSDVTVLVKPVRQDAFVAAIQKATGR